MASVTFFRVSHSVTVAPRSFPGYLSLPTDLPFLILPLLFVFSSFESARIASLGRISVPLTRSFFVDDFFFPPLRHPLHRLPPPPEVLVRPQFSFPLTERRRSLVSPSAFLLCFSFEWISFRLHHFYVSVKQSYHHEGIARSLLLIGLSLRETLRSRD